MSGLGLVSTAAGNPSAATTATPTIDIRLEDVLGHRAAFGCGAGCPVSVSNHPKSGARWWNHGTPTAPAKPLPTLHLVTKIAGSTLETEVAPQADGRFEVEWDVALPPARRGWHLARNRFTLGERHVDVCSLVLTPPENTSSALVVVLPPSATLEPGRLPARWRNPHLRRR